MILREILECEEALKARIEWPHSDISICIILVAEMQPLEPTYDTDK